MVVPEGEITNDFASVSSWGNQNSPETVIAKVTNQAAISDRVFT